MSKIIITNEKEFKNEFLSILQTKKPLVSVYQIENRFDLKAGLPDVVLWGGAEPNPKFLEFKYQVIDDTKETFSIINQIEKRIDKFIEIILRNTQQQFFNMVKKQDPSHRKYFLVYGFKRNYSTNPLNILVLDMIKKDCLRGMEEVGAKSNKTKELYDWLIDRMIYDK